MIGMNKHTGKTIEQTHLQQSVFDIITTPIGSRVMRRDYGCNLFNLIDTAHNEVGELRMKAAIADAIMKWEPRIELEQITIKLENNLHQINIIGNNGQSMAISL